MLHALLSSCTATHFSHILNRVIASDHSLRAVLLSSSTVFLAVIAVIWVDEFYIYFLLGLMIPAQLQGFRGTVVLIHAAGLSSCLLHSTSHACCWIGQAGISSYSINYLYAIILNLYDLSKISSFIMISTGLWYSLVCAVCRLTTPSPAQLLPIALVAQWLASFR